MVLSLLKFPSIFLSHFFPSYSQIKLTLFLLQHFNLSYPIHFWTFLLSHLFAWWFPRRHSPPIFICLSFSFLYFSIEREREREFSLFLYFSQWREKEKTLSIKRKRKHSLSPSLYWGKLRLSPHSTGSIKTTKCCLSIRWYLIRGRLYTRLPTLSLSLKRSLSPHTTFL